MQLALDRPWIYLVFRQKRWRAISSLAIDISFVVCLSVIFVHCATTAEDIDTISLAYDGPMSLPHRFKFWLHGPTPCSRKFTPKWPTPCLFERQTFDGKLRPNGYPQRNGCNGEPIENHHCCSEWYHRWPPTTFPSPKMHPASDVAFRQIS